MSTPDQPEQPDPSGEDGAGNTDNEARPVGKTAEPGKSAKPKRNWIQEERRQTLGDWVSFCLSCGHVQRFFEADEPLLSAACPFCQGEMRHRCPKCEALLPSAFQVECEDCGSELRPNELFGIPIRKKGR